MEIHRYLFCVPKRLGTRDDYFNLYAPGMPVAWKNEAAPDGWQRGFVAPGKAGPSYPEGSIPVTWETSNGQPDLSAFDQDELFIDISSPSDEAPRVDGFYLFTDLQVAHKFGSPNLFLVILPSGAKEVVLDFPFDPEDPDLDRLVIAQLMRMGDAS